MRLFSNSKFKYSSNWIILIVAVVAIAVVFNILCGLLLEKFPIKIDLTPNNALELTPQTKDLLHSLNADINIIVFGRQDTKLRYVDEILDRYMHETPRIKRISVDPDRDPAAVRKYSTVSDVILTGTMVVECGDKFKVLNASDVFPLDREGQRGASINAEGLITSAVAYVTREKNIKVGFVSGHGETDLSASQLAVTLRDANIDFESVSLLDNVDEIDHLVIPGPINDFTLQEIESLDKHLDKGKSLQVLFAIEAKELPRLEQLLSEWGIQVEKNVIIENDTDMIMGGSGLLSAANIIPSEITNPVINRQIPIVMPVSRSITALWEDQYDIKVAPILTSSDIAIVKKDVDAENAPDNITGLFNMGVIASRFEDYEESAVEKGNILVLGSSIMYHDELLTYNAPLFLSIVATLTKNQDTIIVQPKSLIPPALIMQQSTIIMCTIFVTIIIPLIVLLCGLLVWLRRRHL